GVLGVGVVAGQAAAQRPDALVVPAEQRVERAPVTGARCVDQRAVVGRDHHPLTQPPRRPRTWTSDTATLDWPVRVGCSPRWVNQTSTAPPSTPSSGRSMVVAPAAAFDL